MITAVLLSPAFASCSKWLDVMQDDNMTEDQQFSTADGYRSATNGIYQSLSVPELFGKEMTYGFVSALSQYLTSPQVPIVNYQNDAYFYTDRYQFDTPEVRRYAQNIWEHGYKVIADCNNLIQHIEAADRDMFPYADSHFEPEIIRGEAYAVRAFMHFELLRLFGPSPAADMNGRAIPYRDTYPQQFKEFSTTRQVLDRVIDDLELAYDQVVLYDNPVDLEDGIWAPGYGETQVGSRYQVNGNFPGLFFHTRGCRFNSVAIRSLLARVYAYAGDLEKANKLASEIWQDVVVDEQNYPYVTFPTSPQVTSAQWPHKLQEELMIGLYNARLAEDYETLLSAATADNPTYFLKNVDYMYKTYRNDVTDARYAKLITNKATGSAVPLYYSLRYAERQLASNSNSVENEVIPLMRMAELIYIRAEYMAKQGDVPGAVGLLGEHRSKKGATRLLDPAMNLNQFMEELEYDMWKEYTMEGQMFFYWKRSNAPRIRTGATFVEMTADKYVLPIPDSETNFQVQ